MKFLSAPIEFSLEITNLCNLNCRHCNVSATKNAIGDLSTDEWKSLIDELAQLKVFKIILSGGEPFMRPDIFEIIEHIFRYHFRLHINTNGTLIDAETSKFLTKFKRIDCVQVSIEGSRAEIHGEVRPKGSFAPALNAIKTLVNDGLPVSTYTVVNRHNLSDLENIVTLGKDLGVKCATFTNLLPVGSAMINFSSLSLSNSERVELSRTVEEIRKKFGSFAGGPLVMEEDFYSSFANFTSDNNPQTCEKTFLGCGGGFTECAIRPDGWVIPCSRMWEYKIENIRNRTFSDIWNDSEKMTQFRNRRLVKIEDVEECRGCAYAALCCGGCPAVPFQFGRGVNSWDPTSCYKVFTGEKESYVTLP